MSLVLASFGYSVMARVPLDLAVEGPADSESSPAEQNVSSGSPIISESSPVDQTDADRNRSQEGKCQVSASYPEKIRRWCDLITKFARQNNMDPDLIAALIWQESGGDPDAYSRSGAVGLMQVMPRDGLAASFMCVNGPCFASRPTISDLKDPKFNIKYGTGMLAGLVKKYGNLREALKYYGPMDAGYTYADKVLMIFENYRDASN
jgi:soluble lytic murein transglycosylase-like protein